MASSGSRLTLPPASIAPDTGIVVIGVGALAMGQEQHVGLAAQRPPQPAQRSPLVRDNGCSS